MSTLAAFPNFEPEPAQRRWLGSVPAGAGAWWAGILTVPQDASGLAILEVTRHGGADGDADVVLAFPTADLSALAVLLAGLAADVGADGRSRAPGG
jgi:hypothetical protein